MPSTCLPSHPLHNFLREESVKVSGGQCHGPEGSVLTPSPQWVTFREELGSPRRRGQVPWVHPSGRGFRRRGLRVVPSCWATTRGCPRAWPLLRLPFPGLSFAAAGAPHLPSEPKCGWRAARSATGSPGAFLFVGTGHPPASRGSAWSQFKGPFPVTPDSATHTLGVNLPKSETPGRSVLKPSRQSPATVGSG